MPWCFTAGTRETVLCTIHALLPTPDSRLLLFRRLTQSVPARHSVDAAAPSAALQQLLAVDVLQHTLRVLEVPNARQSDLLQLTRDLLLAYVTLVPECRGVRRPRLAIR